MPNPEDYCLCGKLLCGNQEKIKGICAHCHERDQDEAEFQILREEQEGKT